MEKLIRAGQKALPFLILAGKIASLISDARDPNQSRDQREKQVNPTPWPELDRIARDWATSVRTRT